MTTYNNVLDVFSYAAHTLANTLWSERAFSKKKKNTCYSNLYMYYPYMAKNTLD